MSEEIRKIRRSEDTQVLEQRQDKENTEPTQVLCQKCSRVFRRQGDMKRHKGRIVK